MNATSLIEIPDDLAAEAAQVPGLSARLIGFLQAEVSQHRKQQRPHRAQAIEIVKQAKAEAEQMKAAGVTPAEARSEFVKMYVEMIEKLADKP
jgi:hypothetical protein